MNKTIAAACALWLGLGATTAASAADAAKPCLRGPEVESLAAVALPDLIRGAGVACATTLPVDALVRQPSSLLVGRYQAAADAAWPAARAALGKVAPPEVSSLLHSDLLRPMLTGLITAALIGKVKPSDCWSIDRAANLLAPLPPQNTASLVGMVLQLVAEEKAKKQEPTPFPVCPLGSH